MTHALNLVIGATTINLASGTNYLLDYVPQTASSDDDTVTESARLWLTGADQDAVQTAVNNIDGFFRDCRLRQTLKGYDTGYVQISMTNESDTYRSEIIDGRLELDTDAWRHWANNGIECTLIWTRMPYWENTTRTELDMTSATSGTGGISINNGFTVGGPPAKTNSLIINTTVNGSLPTPFEFELTNTYATNRHEHIWVGNMYHPTVNLLPQLDSASGSGSWAGNDWEETYSWTPSDPDQWLGLHYDLVAGFPTSPPSAYWVRWKWQFVLTTIWTSEPVQLTANEGMQSTGIVQAPPWLIGESGLDDIKLILECRFTGGGNLTNAPDLQFFPAYNTRHYRATGYGMPQNFVLVDNGGEFYIEDTGGDKSGYYHAIGNPTLLYPGYANRVFVWVGTDTGGYDTARTSTVQAWYRERRLSV